MTAPRATPTDLIAFIGQERARAEGSLTAQRANGAAPDILAWVERRVVFFAEIERELLDLQMARARQARGRAAA